MQSPLSLLCLPWAGASAMTYMRWRRVLPQWIRIVPLELPGRGSRPAEPAVEDFAQLVAGLHDDYNHMLRGRYALFGHGMGALLAYGLAQRVRDAGGVPPQSLLVSGSAGPVRCSTMACRQGNCGDAELIAELQRQGCTARQVFELPDLMHKALGVMRADHCICSSFRRSCGMQLSMPIHVFGGRQDDILPDGMQAWHSETSAHCTMNWFDGGVRFLREQEETLLAVLAHRLVQDSYVIPAAASSMRMTIPLIPVAG
ncbi:thioesterase II family protein [Oxalicibacterium solurbis]|uniref:Thioesterase n=1 Tax=Oxalicibacterium solurbis TaxID=69280 RepID=A0A8J3AY52_9BURK|nr:thioesterase [Oxalicibacterium solurbis]GGI55042.1 thioesterase [Oxalicibacterium solurbis]